MKKLNNKEKMEELKEKLHQNWNRFCWKIYHKWNNFIRIITLRAYFYDLLQTHVVEEIMITSVTVRHIDNPKVPIDFYETTTIPVKGAYIMVGVYDNKKYYKIKHVVYTNGIGAHVYVKDVKDIENKPFLL